MSTIRIDEKHQKMLDRLIATLILKGNKITKKKLIGEFIENAVEREGILIEEEENLPPLEEDPGWIGLEETFDCGVTDLSKNIDDYVYR